MAWAEKRANGKYRAAWRDLHGKPKFSPAIFLSKKAAMAHGVKEEERARLTIRTAPDNLTWAQWYPEWLKVRRVGEAHAQQSKYQIDKHVLPRWGKVALRAIERHDVQVWVNELATKMAPGTVGKAYYGLNSSLNAALDARLLDANPCARIKLPEPAEGLERYFTLEEVQAVLAELEQPYRAAVAVMVGTGMRFGEMAGLHWQRVDEKLHLVEVVETWSHITNKIGMPKSGHRRMTVMPSWVFAEIGEPSMATACGVTHMLHAAKCTSGLVVPGVHGTPLDSRAMLRDQWYPALDRAKVPRGRQHDLRHTFASWLAQEGTSIDRIADLLGHATTRHTMRYRHMGGTHLAPALAVMEDKFVTLTRPPLAEVAPSFAPPRHLRVATD